MALNDFIEEKIIGFRGSTFSGPESVEEWITRALRDCAKKTVEEVRVKRIEDSAQRSNESAHSFNAAVDCAKTAADRWLGKLSP